MHTVSLPHIWIPDPWLTESTNEKPRDRNCIFIEKNPHIKWTSTVETHVVEGSTVFSYKKSPSKIIHKSI